MPIRNLSTHPAHYLTVGELADYWAVSRQQIYKRIESGALEAIRLGARLYRVPTEAALEFERRANVFGVSPGKGDGRGTPEPVPEYVSDKLPDKIGLRRVGKMIG
jgi:excisionase family DNA binding protein